MTNGITNHCRNNIPLYLSHILLADGKGIPGDTMMVSKDVNEFLRREVESLSY
jgi:hypothetical protein